MLVVKVELWPWGDEAGAKQIAQARIWNDGLYGVMDGRTAHSYRAAVSEEQHAALGIDALYKEVVVEAHDRHQSVWKLVGKVIEKMEEEDKHGLERSARP